MDLTLLKMTSPKEYFQLKHIANFLILPMILNLKVDKSLTNFIELFTEAFNLVQRPRWPISFNHFFQCVANINWAINIPAFSKISSVACLILNLNLETTREKVVLHVKKNNTCLAYICIAIKFRISERSIKKVSLSNYLYFWSPPCIVIM